MPLERTSGVDVAQEQLIRAMVKILKFQEFSSLKQRVQITAIANPCSPKSIRMGQYVPGQIDLSGILH